MANDRGRETIDDSDDGDEGSPAEAAFVGVVLVCLFLALCRGSYTPEVVVFLSLLVVWNAGIISTAEALSGFGNPGMLAIGGLFVVVSSVESSRLADKAAQRVFGLATGFSTGFLRLLTCGVSMSAFCNNTPILQLLIPVTKDWARTRGYDPAVLLMPLAFACEFGGLLTTVGGGTNLVIQGLLYDAGVNDDSVGPFGLFEPGYVGLPLAVAGVAYLLVAAPRLLGKPPPVAAAGGAGAGAGADCVKDRSGEFLTEVEITERFQLVGQPVALVLATLGLPFNTLVKVRRRRRQSVDAQEGEPIRPFQASDTGDSCRDTGIDGGDGGSGGRVDVCAPDAGDEESNGVSWAGQTGGGIVGESLSKLGGGGGLFALRRRAYHPVENKDREERAESSPVSMRPCTGNSSFTGGRGAAVDASIEMAAMRSERSPAARAGRGRDDKPTATRGVGGSICGTPTTGGGGGCWVDDTCDDDVSPHAPVRVGDILVLSAPLDNMVYAQGSVFSGRSKGLKVLGVGPPGALGPLPAPLPLPMPLPGGFVFLELVLSRSSRWLGRTARLDNDLFLARDGCSVVAFRLKGGVKGGVDVVGSSGGGGGDGSGASDAGGVGGVLRDIKQSGGGFFDTVAARRSPKDSAVTPAVIGTAEDGTICERFLLRRGGGPPPVSSAETPLEQLVVASEDRSGSTPGEPGLMSTQRRRRRRRKGEALEAGDVVIVLAAERFAEMHSTGAGAAAGGKFLRLTVVGRLPEPTGWFQCVPLAIFALMLVWVLLGGVEMIRAVFAACAMLILGGWVEAKHAVGHVNWGLLLLIGSALGFSRAMANSGLADFAGEAVRESGMSQSASVYALFGLTMLCTELISNNAAAALNIPVALSMARELKADFKPFAMIVLVAASCSFLTPIGTPTNTLVWEPGGYKFQDYARLGAPLTLLFWVFACAVIPWIFPF